MNNTWNERKKLIFLILDNFVIFRSLLHCKLFILYHWCYIICVFVWNINYLHFQLCLWRYVASKMLLPQNERQQDAFMFHFDVLFWTPSVEIGFNFSFKYTCPLGCLYCDEKNFRHKAFLPFIRRFYAFEKNWCDVFGKNDEQYFLVYSFEFRVV